MMINSINQLAEAWFYWQVSMLWQVAVLVVIVTALDMILKRWAWPKVRYALWLLVLIKLIVPPGFSSPLSIISNTPEIASPVVWVDMNRQAGEPVAQDNTTAAQLPAAADAAHDADLPSQRVWADEPHRRGDAAPAAAMPEPSPTVSQPAETTSTAALADNSLNSYSYLFGIWIAGMVGLAGWVVIRFSQIRRQCLTGNSQQLPERFWLMLDDISGQVGLRKCPPVVLSDWVNCPAVFGVFRPTILMPAKRLKQLNRPNMENILLHELSHIKRGDLLVHALGMVLQIAYWFNPLIWLARRRIRNIRELCCDATVARILKERTKQYRATLLETARQLLDERVDMGLGLLGLFEDCNRLTERLQWLEKKTWRFGKLQTLSVIFISVLMVGCVLPMAKAPATVAPADIEIESTGQNEFTTTLPNGVTVELLGICEHPSEGKQWWRPDGTPYDLPEGLAIEESSTRGDSHDEKAYVVLFKTQLTPEITGYTSSLSTDPSSSVLGARAEIPDGGTGGYSASKVYFENPPQSLSVSKTIATGPWHSETTIPNELGARLDSSNGWIQFTDLEETDTSQKLFFEDTLVEKQLRITPVYSRPTSSQPGRLKNEISYIFHSDSSRLRRTELRFEGLDLSDVKEFQVQTRPWKSATFENVALRPTDMDQMLTSSSVTAEQSLDGGLIATLPSGETVELLGVCEHPSQGSQWWRADGSLLEEPPYDSMNAEVKNTEDFQAYAFALRLDDVPDKLIGEQIQFQPSAITQITGHPLDAPGNEIKDILTVIASVPKTAESVDLRAKIEQHRWETLAESYEVKPDIPTQGSAIATDYGQVIFGNPYEKTGQAFVTATHSIDSTHEVRVIAIDKNDNVLLPNGGASSAFENTTQTTAGFDAALDGIKLFRFQIMIKQWVEFKDVALRPSVKTAVEVVIDEERLTRDETTESELPAAVEFVPEKDSNNTEFTTRLPNGVTVELVGICEHPSQGRQWWRPDGSLLDDRPYEKLRRKRGDVYPVYELVYRISNGGEVISKVATGTGAVMGTSGPFPVTEIAQEIRIDRSEEVYYSDITSNVKAGDIVLLVGDDNEWKTDTSLDGDIENSGVNGPSAMISSAIETDGKVFVHISHTVTDGQYRVVAVDVNGVVHKPRSLDGAYSYHNNMGHLQVSFDLSADEIEVIEFQTQKFERVEFKNVALRPDFAQKPEAAAQQTAQTSGKLEFRVVPSLSPQQAEEIPFPLSDADGYKWLPVRKEDDSDEDRPWYTSLPHRTVDNTVYVLTSDKPDETLLADGTWGLQNVYEISTPMGRSVVGFDFDENGADLFYRLTSQHIGMQLAIIIDGAVYSAPRIQSAIREKGVITGSFDGAEIARLIDILRSDMPPVVPLPENQQSERQNQQSDSEQKPTSAADTDAEPIENDSFADDHWRHIYPDQTYIRLVAVFNPGEQPVRFWDPQGRPIPGLDDWLENWGPNFENENNLGLVLEHVPIAQDIVPASDGKHYMVRSVAKDNPVIMHSRGWGPWQDITKAELDNVVVHDGNWYKLETVQPFANRQVRAAMHYSRDTEFGIRLVAVDEDGNRFPMAGKTSSTGATMPREYYVSVADGIGPDQVSHFMIQKQKLDWAVIGGFATELNGSADLDYQPPQPLFPADSVDPNADGWKTLSTTLVQDKRFEK